VTIVGIPAKDSLEAMRDFVDRHGLGDMPQIADLDEDVWPRFGVGYQPAWVFIDDGGDVRVHAGALAGPDLDAAIADLTSR
jgi:hypothetical protein